MELTLAKCQTVLDTLPIGYYVGRRVNCSLDEKAKTSFYSPMEDSIVISYPLLAHRAKMAKEEDVNVDEFVRSMLYHEVSHVIMTTDERSYFEDETSAYNIFEDERIETVLKDYYIGVDFKKQLWEIHGNKVPVAKDKDSAFFNAVRFRIAPKNILDRIDSIIKKYGELNRTSPWYGAWCDYVNEIRKLYDEITKDYPSRPKEYNPSESGMSGGERQMMDKIKGNSEGEESDSKNSENAEGMSGEEKEKDGEGEKEGKGKGDKDGEEGEKKDKEISKEESEIAKERDRKQKIFGGCLCSKPKLDNEKQKQLDEFTKTVELIIGNFNKKNKGGSGINAYSGVFNPRAVAREDYRYFDRSMSTNGNNKFGTCHLNLFIDCSGSMGSNTNVVNGIIASLTEIERKNRNFTMDVSFINHYYEDCETIRDRKFRAWGGNRIPADMKERFIKRQLPNTCNYNIVLFDGDAMCDNSDLRGREDYIKRFSAFDYKQTTLITDSSNQRYLGSGYKSAKVVVTDRYTDELISHITKALMVAFG